MLRRVLAVGLVLTLVGVLVPGFHHIRCEATIRPDGAGAGESTVLPCVVTFPTEVALGAAMLGVAAALVVLVAGLRLARLGDPAGPRALLALAAMTLAVPALTILAGWGSAGFDLRFADESGSCRGPGAWADPPLWLQTPMCVNAFDVVRVPLLALAGIAAAIGAFRPQRRVLPIGVLAAALAVLSIAAAILVRSTEIALVWSLPVVGTLLLAAGGWLARRQARAHPDVPVA